MSRLVSIAIALVACAPAHHRVPHYPRELRRYDSCEATSHGRICETHYEEPQLGPPDCEMQCAYLATEPEVRGCVAECEHPVPFCGGVVDPDARSWLPQAALWTAIIGGMVGAAVASHAYVAQ